MFGHSRGLQFCPVDLHVHTPASKCFHGYVSPAEYVQQAITAGMRAIAITDHNTGDWIDCIKEAAAGIPLTVFPGVEISVQPGIHILAIFPEDRTTAHVNDMLARMGLSSSERGEQEALVTQYGAEKVVDMIRDEGALPVLAHIDEYNGAWHDLSGQMRVQLWQRGDFAAVEIVNERLPAQIGTIPFERKPAYYWSSDNPYPENRHRHSHLGIGSRCSLFKLEEPITWEGLRLCFHDPTVRIRPAAPFRPIELQSPKHPVLTHVTVDGGFLDGLDLPLNPNLNCIIGGRGTGKSTLLELIRYGFDVAPKTEDNAKQAESIVESTFPAGSQITIWARAVDGTSYRIERSSREKPAVYRGDETRPIDVTPSDLIPIQAYGQKEIYEISQDPEFQLRLLDNYLAEDLEPLEEDEDELLRRLKENADAILLIQEKIETAEDRLSGLGTIREQLRRMEEQDFVERLKTKNIFEQEKRLLDRAQGQIDTLLEKLAELSEESGIAPDVIDDEEIDEMPHRALLEGQRALLDRAEAALQRSMEALQAEIQTIWAASEPGRTEWEDEYQAQSKIHQELLREFQDSQDAVSAERFERLQKRRSELEELQDRTEEDRDEVDSLWQQRRNLLKELRQNRRRQYEVRTAKAEELTRALGKKVRITIHPAGNREAYASVLEELFSGLGVRKTLQQQLAETEVETPEREAERPVMIKGETRYLVPGIPRYLDPIDLADAIRCEQQRDDDDESKLENRWGIDSDAMRRRIAGVSAEALFEFETYSVPDLPVIELQVGSGDLGYKPLTELSVGQKCTALLAIILLESSATLLVDQPEDDLDNQFIFDRIVDTLRKEKERRQFIIATHNANIPVSADAELIVVIQANERKGWIDEDGIGSIDAQPIKEAVGRILEGGKQAFQIRKEKYGI